MSVTDQAIEKIKEMILSGALLPGARLPNEADLAELLVLSRSSLREAVRALTAMRILVPKQGDGTYVSGLEPHLLLESLAFAADASRGHTALQLIQVRRLLEPPVTGLAADKVTEEQLAVLRAILDRSAENISIEEFVELDLEFHRTIADTVGNPVLSTLLGILSTHTQRLRIVRGIRHAPAQEQAHRDHGTIWRALAIGDSGLAASASAVHVASVEEWLANGFTTDSPSFGTSTS
ncbi:transcriptional regulator, GntR family [Streptomyces sp. TLI_053]|uniref:FadR/GntR family transcriptional regulator n=1 Tax=Streptomyces sp. TLI_053 TaxID=1855352 RepID=UPI00087C3630|nr:FadR/GntR family transcriptional regulator [Streptomyces sp. TLI_053]SDS53027.1 transcriptional regulator, GntR family [Streptomyces sp. TLI_053]